MKLPLKPEIDNSLKPEGEDAIANLLGCGVIVLGLGVALVVVAVIWWIVR